MRTSGQRKRVSGLYAIADSQFNPFSSLTELVQKYLEGGCRIIQLRMKYGSEADVRKQASEIIKFKQRYDFTFIVNDYVDVALEVGADGVHVGANDEPIENIGERAGKKLFIGYSSHSLKEACDAEKKRVNYIAFGAIFPTRTKGEGHPVQGLARLRQVTQAVSVPVVAIGGIGRNNLQGVIDAGADAVAMITSLSLADDIISETRWFIKTYASNASKASNARNV
ncbi:MAG: thiamine phosphate synthase [Pseudomonadota bacterium]